MNKRNTSINTNTVIDRHKKLLNKSQIAKYIHTETFTLYQYYNNAVRSIYFIDNNGNKVNVTHFCHESFRIKNVSFVYSIITCLFLLFHYIHKLYTINIIYIYKPKSIAI